MHRHTIRRALVVALPALAFAGTAGADTPGPQPTQPGGSQGKCQKLSNPIAAGVPFRYNFLETSVIYNKRTKKAHKTQTLENIDGSLGSLSLRAETCRISKGNWKVTKNVSVDYTSAGLDGNGDVIGEQYDRGMAIGLRRAKYRRGKPLLIMQMMRCEQADPFKIVHELLGIPFPVGKYVGVALYAAGKIIPEDKSPPKCDGMGTVDVELTATSTGGLLTNPHTDTTKVLQFVRDGDLPGSDKYNLKRTFTFSVLQPQVNSR